MTYDVRAAVREGDMSAFQIVAVSICMAINMVDGFDVLAIAFTGPLIAEEWDLDPASLGALFSSGIAGMMLGSLFISPFADMIGRRAVVLICLGIVTVGMMLSGISQSVWELGAYRVLTGLGIGGLLSSINTIVVEYSSYKRKDLGVAWMAVGYPIGATIGGIISVYLIAQFGWRSVFVFGGLVSLALIPLVMVRLPESLDFLIIKRPANALARMNLLLRKMSRNEIDALPEIHDAQESAATSALSVFDRAFFARTALICIAYFTVMLSFYFVLNWTPKVLVDRGLSLELGISGSILMNVGGIVGGMLLGFYTARWGLKEMASYFMVALFFAILAFGFTGTNLPLLLILTLTIGFFSIGSIVSLYAIMGAAYPVRIRNTGTGLALGLGRLGAMFGPYLGGVLIAAEWSAPAYCLVLGAPVLIAALVVRRIPLLFTAKGASVSAA